jgi:endonuclease III-like uncharacterized protein
MEMFDLLMNHFGPQNWWPAEFFNEFHALIVKVGKEYYGRKPVCSTCPLEEW